MAYYAALVSFVELLKEMRLSEYQYPKYRLQKRQITRLYEKFSHLQVLLDDYYPPNDEETDGFLERIREVACRVEHFIERQTSDAAYPKLQKAYHNSESESISVPESEPEPQIESETISGSESEPESGTESESISGSESEPEPEAVSESEPENEGVVETTRKGYQDFLKLGEILQGYQDLLKLREVIRHVVEVGYDDLEKTKKEVDSFMGEGYLDVVKLKEELDSIEIKGYQNLVKLKEELHATIRRGHQDLERVKEEVDYVVGKGYDGLLEKVLKKEVDPIVEELRMRIKESHTTHQEDLLVTIDGPSDDGSTMVVLDENPIATIKSQLLRDSSKLEVISIAGMGGIGKTTLARHIFDDKGVRNHFDIRVWVTISQSYQLRKILLAIAKSLNIDEGEDEVLKDRIRKHLFGWRYLIIMDDVWDAQIWDVVRWIFLNDDKSRSRIMITTRQSDVASLASESDFINQIPILSYDQSWTLFCEKVHCPPELEDIGRVIVKHCGGLPLAIVVVAGLLSKVNTTRSDWEEVARGMSSSAAANYEHLSKILSLSYYYLPHHLKPCFLYLGGFPEDDEIPILFITTLWVAEGFLKPIASKSLEEAAEEYLEELVKRNLVLIVKRRSNGEVKSCIMHDLLRDLCIERARHEHFFLLPNKHNATERTHRFFISPESPLDIDMLRNNVPHVRSIVSSNDETEVDLKSHPSCFKPLRVLWAPLARSSFHGDGVFELLNLRMLELEYPRSKIPSSISQLQHLQTFVGGSISYKLSFPAEIWEMPRLRHVICDNLKLPPCSDGGSNKSDGLPSLQTLFTLLNFIFTSRIVQMLPSIKKLKLEYSPCKKNVWTKFGLINLVHLHQLETIAIEIVVLNRANVMPFPESFAFPSNLRKLTLKGCKLPWRNMTVVGSLPHLQVLKLKWDAFLGEEWESKEGEFSKLKFLGMYNLYEIKYRRTDSTHFPCLEHLVINDCDSLEEIPSEIGEFPNLKLIEVWSNNSRLKASALEIQEEQLSVGNETLEVRVYDSTALRIQVG